MQEIWRGRVQQIWRGTSGCAERISSSDDGSRDGSGVGTRDAAIETKLTLAVEWEPVAAKKKAKIFEVAATSSNHIGLRACGYVRSNILK